MSVEKIAMGIIERDFSDLAERVEAAFKGEVAKHTRTGQALGSIHVMSRSPQKIVIGGQDDHLYWLDEGNGHSGAIIYSKKGKALGKYPDGIPGIGWRASVKAYKGFHVAKAAADKFR